MILTDECYQYINGKVEYYERRYRITVLCWWFRSTVNIGIFRGNSDLDIAVLFRDEHGRIKVFHDFDDCGFDLWGVEIDILLSMLRFNNQCYYENPGHIPVILDSYSGRAGCNYYFGIFSAIGNSWLIDSKDFLAKTKQIFLSVGEPVLMVRVLLEPVEKNIRQLSYFHGLYLYDYLMSIWRILVSFHVLDGGEPGHNHVLTLCRKYGNAKLYEALVYCLEEYRKSSEKKMVYRECPEFNEFIKKQFVEIVERIKCAKPQSKKMTEAYLNILSISKKI